MSLTKWYPESILLALLVTSSLFSGCKPAVHGTDLSDGKDQHNQHAISMEYEEIVVMAQGDSLYVKTTGQGAPILFIHGGPGLNHSYFLPHMYALSNEYQLIFYDQRASGRSAIDVDSTTISLDGFLEDIESIREHFMIDHWNIIGHSWGGLLTFHYALKYPKAIDKLVVVNSIPGSSELQQEVQDIQRSRETAEDSLTKAEIMSSTDFKNGKIEAYERLFKALFAAQFYNRNYADSLQLNFQSSFLKGNNQLRHLAKDVSEYDIHLALKDLHNKILLVYGANDPLSEHTASTYARFLPNAQLLIIPHAGHFPFIEQKEAFFHAVSQFLGDGENEQ